MDGTPTTDTLNQIGEDLLELIKRNAAEAGIELRSDVDSIAEFAAQQASSLAAGVGEPGFDRALVAARDSVALHATSEAIDRADAVDARLMGIIEGGLALGARALSLLA